MRDHTHESHNLQESILATGLFTPGVNFYSAQSLVRYSGGGSSENIRFLHHETTTKTD